MSIEDIEASEQDGSARELIDVTYGNVAHRITTATRDISYGGVLYLATAAKRGPLPTSPIDEEDALELTLPIDHAFVRRFVLQFAPPLRVSVRVRRLYETDEIETVWLGYITSMSVNDENTQATFRIPPRGADAAQRRLPTISVTRLCPYMLYSHGCEVSRTASVGGLAHKVSTTVAHVNGREVRVNLADSDRLPDWAEGGELVVTGGSATGDRMAVVEQSTYSGTTATLTLQMQIPGLKVGDGVDVYAGCDRTITTCRTKFDNKDNYGGSYLMPTDNPYKWER
jgi:hypothetical protein